MTATALKTVDLAENEQVWPADQIERRPLATLIPYARNARLHSDAQISQLAGSMSEYGWTMPILVDEHGGIIAGHGRVMAAQLLANAGHDEFATARVMVARGWSEAQKKAYVIADNKLALNADWDEELLKLELADLQEMGASLDLTGFSAAEIDDLFAEGEDGPEGEGVNYSRKVVAPVYEPTGDLPPVSSLADVSRTLALIDQIRAADLPDDIRAFLELAAQRHTAFHFGRIAEFYAHQPPEVQRLMEASALVIIDFNAAIEGGFVKLTDQLTELAGINGPTVDD